MKKCTKCQEVKTFDLYYVKKKGFLYSMCKLCYSKKNKMYFDKKRIQQIERLFKTRTTILK